MRSHGFGCGVFVLGLCGVLVGQSAQHSAEEHLQRALQLADLNNWSEAAPDFGEAESMFATAGDRRNSLYAHLGTIRATVTQRDLAATSAQLEGELEDNPLLETDNRLRMFCLIVKGDIDGEIDSGAMHRDWAQVAVLARELGDVKWQYRSLGQLGLAAFYDGDLQTARRNVGAALIAATENHDAGAQIRFLTAAGIGLREAHTPALAMQYFEKALHIAAATPDAGYPFLTNEARLEALIDIGQTDAAQWLAHEIMASAHERNLAQHEAIVLTFLAHVARARNDTDAAIGMFHTVLGVSASGGLSRELADAQSSLADIYRERGDLAQADQFANLAVATTQARGNAWALPQRLSTLARIESARGRYTESEETYDRAGAIVDGLLGRYSGIPEKTALIHASSDLYTGYFSLLADRIHNPEKAYEVVEQVRGRVMADLLLAGSVTSPEARKEERALSELQLKLVSTRSAAAARKLRDQIFLAQQTRWVTPGISILKAISLHTVGIDQVEHTLSPSAAILEYVVAEPKSYCLVISRAGVHIVPLAGTHALRAGAVAYLRAATAKQPAHEEARHLYSLLIAPVLEVTRETNLVIVRDGILHLLPFDAFVGPRRHYLVETHTVAYAPSATAFCLLSAEKNRQRRFTHGLLAIGGIPYGRNGLKLVATTRGYSGSALSDLPASKDEVLAADHALRGSNNTALLGSEATESAFKRAPLADYRILHLAVHGFASPVDSEQAALVLLSDPRAGEDGLLYPAEIVQLGLNAELAILSACDTAVGPVQGEEGIETLSRAFLLAGARGVISTLWSVDDTFSLFLMKQFYQHLASGKSATTALVAAKRDMLRKYGAAAVPYYWAGYTIEGAFDGATIRGPQEQPIVSRSKRAN